jgi:transposase
MTARAAKAAARKGVLPLAMRIRDELGEVFPDAEFEAGFGERGAPGWSPGRLALITVLQMAENLTDRGAAERIRFGLDWKYALSLEVDDPGIDHSVLSEFRTRVAEHDLEEKVLDLLLASLAERGLLGPGGKARTDSTHVIAAVRNLNRLELAGESVRACVEALAVAAPDWLAATIDVPDWSARYTARVDSWRLPASETKRAELALAYARDGYALIEAIYAPGTPTWISQVEAVQVLRVVLLQNYLIVTDRQGREVIKRREADKEGLPPGRSRLTSPYDTDARWGVKRDTFWNGYKVHLTETCHDDPPPPQKPPCGHSDPCGPSQPATAGRRQHPNLITNVATTDATVADAAMTAAIHQQLADRGLTPDEHYVDSGYPSARLVADAARRHGITLVSPMLADCSRQAREAGGFHAGAFTIGWDARQAICPQGQRSTSWIPATQRGEEVIVVRFDTTTCRTCPVRPQCTTAKRSGRVLTLKPRPLHEALAAARSDQDTRSWQQKYRIRAGAESTMRQAVAVTGTRRTRYRGLAKTHLEHVYSAVALNLIRLDAYWNDQPLDRHRTSHLARLEQRLHAA